jgi:hypothetical protein
MSQIPLAHVDFSSHPTLQNISAHLLALSLLQCRLRKPAPSGRGRHRTGKRQKQRGKHRFWTVKT